MLFEIIGILADVIAVLTLWGVGSNSPWWVKGLIILAVIVVTIVMKLLGQKNKLEEPVKDFDWDNPDEYAKLFIKNSNHFVDNSVASIYMVSGNSKKLVALGYVIIEEGKTHIKVFKYIDLTAMLMIKANLTNYKNFSIKPSVRYDDYKSLNV